MAGDQAAQAAELDTFQQRLDQSLCTWPSKPSLYTRANAVDQWPKPITPLTHDLIMWPQERGIEDAFATELGLAEASPPWTWNGVFYGWVTYGVGPSAELADAMPGWSRAGVYADYFGVTEDPDAPPQPRVRIRPVHLLSVIKNFLRAQRTYARRSDRMRAEAQRQLGDDLKRDWTVEPVAGLIDRISGHTAIHRAQRVPHALANVIAAAQLDRVVKSVAKLTDDKPLALVLDAVTGLGGIHLAEASDAMRQVAAGRMSRAEFVHRYGFRGTNEFELSAKPWSEDTNVVRSRSRR